jgi:hypothetical protein
MKTNPSPKGEVSYLGLLRIFQKTGGQSFKSRQTAERRIFFLRQIGFSPIKVLIRLENKINKTWKSRNKYFFHRKYKTFVGK